MAAWRPTFLIGFALGACSTAPKLQGRGEQCLLVTDCQLGLVCVNQPDRSRRCSSDLSPIVNTEDAASAVASGTLFGDSGSDVPLVAIGDDGGDASDEAAQDEPAPE